MAISEIQDSAIKLKRSLMTVIYLALAYTCVDWKAGKMSGEKLKRFFRKTGSSCHGSFDGKKINVLKNVNPLVKSSVSDSQQSTGEDR